MLLEELYGYLGKNKYIIEHTKVEKSNTQALEGNPVQMLEETVVEVETINKRELDLQRNSQHYNWYSNATE